MKSLSRLALCGLLVVAAVLGFAGSALGADRTRCEQIEAALRSAGVELGYTGAELDGYVQRGSAACWAEVAEAEAAEARQAEEERVADERFAAEEAAKAARERREARAIREARRIDREEAQRRRRIAQRHRREWTHKPTVTKPIALEFASRLMRRSEFTVWWLECDQPGQINRIIWTCKVSIFYRCLRGRIRITGAGIKDGRKYYSAAGGRLRQCRV